MVLGSRARLSSREASEDKPPPGFDDPKVLPSEARNDVDALANNAGFKEAAYPLSTVPFNLYAIAERTSALVFSGFSSTCRNIRS